MATLQPHGPADGQSGGHSDGSKDSNGTGGGGKPFTGKKMLLCMVAFFGVILAANLTMMGFALNTHTGVVVKSSYVASQDFNRTKAASDAQKQLGWQVSTAYLNQAVKFTLLDRESAPIRGLQIIGFIGRPVTDADDIQLAFKEFAPGVYVAAAALKPGIWQADVTASAKIGPHRGKTFRQIFRLQVEESSR